MGLQLGKEAVGGAQIAILSRMAMHREKRAPGQDVIDIVFERFITEKRTVRADLAVGKSMQMGHPAGFTGRSRQKL